MFLSHSTMSMSVVCSCDQKDSSEGCDLLWSELAPAYRPVVFVFDLSAGVAVSLPAGMSVVFVRTGWDSRAVRPWSFARCREGKRR